MEGWCRTVVGPQMHDVLLHRSRRQRKRAQVEVFGLVPGGKLQCAWPSSENCAPAAKNEFQSFKVMSPHCSLKSNPLRHTSSPVAKWYTTSQELGAGFCFFLRPSFLRVRLEWITSLKQPLGFWHSLKRSWPVSLQAAWLVEHRPHTFLRLNMLTRPGLSHSITNLNTGCVFKQLSFIMDLKFCLSRPFSSLKFSGCSKIGGPQPPSCPSASLCLQWLNLLR